MFPLSNNLFNVGCWNKYLNVNIKEAYQKTSNIKSVYQSHKTLVMAYNKLGLTVWRKARDFCHDNKCSPDLNFKSQLILIAS